MRGHSRSSQREKVKQARAIADAALGDAAHRDYRSEPIIKAVPRDESHLVHPADESIQVLTVREAAVRVGLSSNELERHGGDKRGEVADGGVDHRHPPQRGRAADRPLADAARVARL